MATNTGPSGTLYRVRIGLALAATGVVLAACGSSSKAASTTGTVTTGPSTASTSKASSGSGKVNTDLGGGSFCDKAKQASANVTAAAGNLTSDTPEQLKTFEEGALSELKALRDQAPSEIKGPIGTVVDAEQKLVDNLQQNNFDFTKISSQLSTLFSTPQFTAAEGQLTSYLSAKCGIDPSAVSS